MNRNFLINLDNLTTPGQSAERKIRVSKREVVFSLSDGWEVILKAVGIRKQWIWRIILTTTAELRQKSETFQWAMFDSETFVRLLFYFKKLIMTHKIYHGILNGQMITQSQKTLFMIY